MVSPVTEELRNFIFNQFPKLFRDAKLIEIENNKENLKGFTKELINNLNDVIKERTDSNKLQAKILKQSSKENKVLLIRTGGIGDIIYTFPIAQYLKSRNPNLKITVATNKNYMDLVKCTDSIDEVIEFNNRLNLSLYDQVFNFKGAIESNKKSESMHYVDAYYDWIGIDPKEVSGEFKLPKMKSLPTGILTAARIWDQWKLDDNIVVGVSLKATSRLRTWNHNNIIKFVKALASRGIKVLLLDNTTEYEFGGKNIISLCGTLDIIGLVGVISKLDLLVAPDTGLIHIAGAVGTPLVGIYQAFNPEYRLKYYKNAAWITPNYKCAPCYYHLESMCKEKERGSIPPCMTNVLPKDVFLLARKVLAKTKKIDIVKLKE